jgi:hypothetical protein
LNISCLNFSNSLFCALYYDSCRQYVDLVYIFHIFVERLFMNWYSLIILRTILIGLLNGLLLLLIKIPFLPAVYNFYDKALQSIERKTGSYSGWELAFKKGIELDIASYMFLFSLLLVIPFLIATFTSRYHIVWEKESKSEKAFVTRTSSDLLNSLVKIK